VDDYALALNAGSSSLKFCVYWRPEGKEYDLTRWRAPNPPPSAQKKRAHRTSPTSAIQVKRPNG